MNDQQTSDVLSLPRPLKRQQQPQLHLIETCPDRVDHLREGCVVGDPPFSLEERESLTALRLLLKMADPVDHPVYKLCRVTLVPYLDRDDRKWEVLIAQYTWTAGDIMPKQELLRDDVPVVGVIYAMHRMLHELQPFGDGKVLLNGREVRDAEEAQAMAQWFLTRHGVDRYRD